MVNERFPLEKKLNWLSKPSSFADLSHEIVGNRGSGGGGGTSLEVPKKMVFGQEPRQLLAHPPVQPVLKTQTGYNHLPNRFAEKLYLKYPFLLPKIENAAAPKSNTNPSSYSTDYRDPKDVIDEMVVIRRFTGGGGGSAEGLKPPLRYPQVPYVAFMRESLSKEFESFINYEPPPGRYMAGKGKKEKPPELVTMKPLPKCISEYDANINGMARYMKKKKIFTLPSVLVHHQPTLED